MGKKVLFFFTGIACVFLSLLLSFSILTAWFRTGLSAGYQYVSVESIVFAGIWIGVVCVVLGTIGGYLIGRYIEEFRQWAED